MKRPELCGVIKTCTHTRPSFEQSRLSFFKNTLDAESLSSWKSAVCTICTQHSPELSVTDWMSIQIHAFFTGFLLMLQRTAPYPHACGMHLPLLLLQMKITTPEE